MSSRRIIRYTFYSSDFCRYMQGLYVYIHAYILGGPAPLRTPRAHQPRFALPRSCSTQNRILSSSGLLSSRGLHHFASFASFIFKLIIIKLTILSFPHHYEVNKTALYFQRSILPILN